MNEREIFLAAMDIGIPDQREAYLRSACGTDVALLERVGALLKSQEDAGSFLERPVLEQVGHPASASDTPTTSLAGNSGAVDSGDTTTGPTDVTSPPDLTFLKPSSRPGALGRLAHYDILKVIGRGGMGIVLQGYDEKLQRVVAIKVMAPQLAASATARKRFEREAKAAAAVSHDHVITIHAVDQFQDLPYLVMYCVEGSSLQEKIDRSGPLGLKEILRIGMQTAQGLAAAHAQGLVHRDVKPANILLENGIERVKLTDFGLARAVDDASMTQSGVITGTPQYMSPEQAEGKAIDHRSDLFSLGSVLYAMCTGHSPFRASTTMGVLKRVCEDTPRPVQEVNPEVPDWLCGIIERLHAKQPGARYQSAEQIATELGNRLARIQQPGYIPKVHQKPRNAGRTPSWGKRHWLLFGISTLVCAIVFTAAVKGWYELRVSPSPWVEWTSAGLCLFIGVITVIRSNLTGWGRLLGPFIWSCCSFGLALLGYYCWPYYTVRYFEKLMIQGKYAEASQMVVSGSRPAFDLEKELLTINAPSGIFRIPLDGIDRYDHPIFGSYRNESESIRSSTEENRFQFWIKLPGHQVLVFLYANQGHMHWREESNNIVSNQVVVHNDWIGGYLRASDWNDLQTIQGTWTAWAVEKQNQAFLPEQAKSVRVTIFSNEIHMTLPDSTVKGRFRLDSSSSPKQMIITRSGGKNQESRLNGIYELRYLSTGGRNIEELRICMGDPEDEPTTFSTKSGKNVVLLTLRRERDHHFYSDWEGDRDAWSWKENLLIGDVPGTTKPVCLWSPRRFRDFEMKFSVMAPGRIFMSGLLIRAQGPRTSRRVPLEGMLIDIGHEWGKVQHLGFEGGIGSWDELSSKSTVLRSHEFNEYFIRCNGRRLMLKINNETKFDKEMEHLPLDGLIGFAFRAMDPTKITIKDLVIRELKSTSGEGSNTPAKSTDTTQHDQLIELARQQRDQVQERYNAGQVPIDQYLQAQIKWLQARLDRAVVVKDLKEQEQILVDQVSMWTKQVDVTKERHKAGVILLDQVLEVEKGLVKAQAQLRQVREEQRKNDK